MQYYAGIDISLEQSSVCVVDAAGKITKEAKIASDPCVLATFFKGLGFPVTRIGFEAGPLSHWLYAGLTQAGFDVVLLETRHVKAALSAMVVKTDRKDARGIAQLLRMRWYQSVHAKSASSQEIRALLTGRRLLLDKLRDVELSLRGVLRGFGLKLGKVTQRAFEARARACRQSPDAAADHWIDAPGARDAAARAQYAPQGASQDRTPRQGLPAIYDRTRCRSDYGDHVQDGGRRSAPDQEIERGRTAIWINP